MWLPQIDPTLIKCPRSVQKCTNTHTHPPVLLIPCPSRPPTPLRSPFLPEVLLAQCFWSVSKKKTSVSRFLFFRYFATFLKRFCYTQWFFFFFSKRIKPPTGVQQPKRPLGSHLRFGLSRYRVTSCTSAHFSAIVIVRTGVAAGFGPFSAGIWSVWI